MQPSNPTPSIWKPIPFSAEHIEAKQAEVNAERAAYVATLSLDVQKRFAAVEKAAQILEKAKVPFQLHAAPEHEQLWIYGKRTYLEDVTTPEAIKEAERFAWAVGVKGIEAFATTLNLMIPICRRDGGVIYVANPPDEAPKA